MKSNNNDENNKNNNDNVILFLSLFSYDVSSSYFKTIIFYSLHSFLTSLQIIQQNKSNKYTHFLPPALLVWRGRETEKDKPAKLELEYCKTSKAPERPLRGVLLDGRHTCALPQWCVCVRQCRPLTRAPCWKTDW